MPTARKTAAKKTAAKKTAAPRQNQTEKAVEASLKVYKTRVASKVEHYRDRGDLCDEEYHAIREDLDLKEFLKVDRTWRFKVEFRGTADIEGGCGAPENHAEELAEKLLQRLVEGVEVPCGGKTMTVRFASDSEVWEANLEDWS